VLVLRARREAIVNAPPCTSGLGAGAPGRGEVPVDGEAVEVLAPGPQPAELDVHGVATVRAGGRGVATGDPRERSSSATSQATSWTREGMPPMPSSASGVRREPGPDDEAVRCGIPGRDAEGERVAEATRAALRQRGAG